MMWALKQLSVPLNYLRIRHGSGLFHSKLTYDFVIPIILAVITVAAFASLDIKLAVFEHPELVKRFSDLLALMIVFYMAALAAVATFDREGIDTPLKGADATLYVRDPDGGKWKQKPLNYRQFISYLFGFLSLLSLVTYVFLAVMSVGWPQFETYLRLHSSQWYTFVTDVVDPILFFVMFFLVWELLVTSLLGIYFLTERIQTLSDPKP